VFLPAPDLTSFLHTFLGSAYMGNSMGESWRSGHRFFEAFPVAGQVPRLSDGEIDTADEPTTTSTPRANREFFGASWAYGVQADRNINRFFPVFDAVEPSGITVAPGVPVTLRARLLPFQSPLAISAAIRPPAPAVLSGEPVTGLPRVALVKVSGTIQTGEVWEAEVPAEILAEEGPYRVTFAARFTSDRLSDPETAGFTVSDEPDPDATALRAVLAFGTSSVATTEASLGEAAGFAYKVYLDRFRPSADDASHEEWIDLFSDHGDPYAPPTARRAELRARAALAKRTSNREFSGGVSAASVLSAIAARAAEGDRLYLHFAVEDASGEVLRFSATESITAAQLDAALDAAQAADPALEVMTVVDGSGSGSFLAPLASTGAQRRVTVTSVRATDCALFLADPAITFTHKLVGPLWAGESVERSFQAADGFQRGFAGNFVGQRIAPQLDDNGDGVFTAADGDLAGSWYLGRRYAFAGDEASGLPFVLEAEVIPPSVVGGLATLRAHLLEGVEPSLDLGAPGSDPLAKYRVWARLVPNGVVCGDGAELPRYRMRRDSGSGWSWSVGISAGLLPEGTHAITFLAEYDDGPSTRKTCEPVFGVLDTRPVGAASLIRAY